VLTITGVINYSISEFTGARTRRKPLLAAFLGRAEPEPAVTRESVVTREEVALE